MKEKIYNSLPERYKQERFLYRGFSIEKKGEEIIILDIRSAYYLNAFPSDLKVMLEKGFMDGATYLLMLSDIEKIERYKILEKKNKELAKKSTNPRKKQEHVNSAAFNKQRVNYYSLQVRRWEKQLAE
jgi:hypothetical protein